MYLKQITKFWRRPISDKTALLEAALLLALAQILIKAIPYSRWSRLLGPISSERQGDGTVTETEIAGNIAWVVNTAARYLPWNAVCMPRAMVVKWMLARRKVSSTLFLGARSTGRSNDVDLHAWLDVGRQTIIGGEVADEFKVIACYGA